MTGWRRLIRIKDYTLKDKVIIKDIITRVVYNTIANIILTFIISIL